MPLLLCPEAEACSPENPWGSKSSTTTDYSWRSPSLTDGWPAWFARLSLPMMTWVNTERDYSTIDPSWYMSRSSSPPTISRDNRRTVHRSTSTMIDVEREVSSDCAVVDVSESFRHDLVREHSMDEKKKKKKKIHH